MSLADLYVDMLETPSDIVEHLPTFVDLVLDLDAKKVIELGVRWATSTVAWLYALEQTDGHLWSVDVQPCAVSIPTDRWTFLVGDDTSAEILDQIDENGHVDIVFIDTSHAYNHTLQELVLYTPLVRPGGRILLHDTELAQPEGIPPEEPFPVKRAITDFCEAQGLHWTNAENCYGLGIIEVP